MASYVIGRGPAGVDIIVPAGMTSVSRVHLRITTTTTQRFLLEDLNSSGGTYIWKDGSWTPILRKEVSADDKIRLAHFETSVRDLLRTSVQPELERPKSIGSGYDVFISYAREDQEAVRPLVQLMERQGWRVFWDRKIQAGQHWANLLDRTIGEARAIVVVWTRASVKSDWVKAEAMTARQLGRIVPIKLEDVSIPLPFGLIQTTNITEARSDSERQVLIQDFLTAIGSLIRRPVEKLDSADIFPHTQNNTIRQFDWMHVLFNLDGRIGRKEFWLAGLIFVPAFVLLNLLIETAVSVKMASASESEKALTAASLYYLITLYVSIAITSKRLHDMGWSGYWQFLLQPIWFFGTLATAEGASTPGAVFGLGMLVTVVWLGLTPGKAGANAYGPPPGGR